MAYGDFKDLPRRTASDKVLHDKAINIAKNATYDGYQRGLDSIVYKSFDKKTFITNKGTGINSENKELAEELHKPIIRKSEKWKVHSSFTDNIWDTDLVDMQLLSKFKKGIYFFIVLLIFLVNMLRLFLRKIKKVLQLQNLLIR